VFYKTVHAVLPKKIREPLRNAVKGPPPTPEELADQRRAEDAERHAQRDDRDRASQVAAKERRARAKAEADSAKRGERLKDAKQSDASMPPESESVPSVEMAEHAEGEQA
jgi:hypothetical protein